MRKKRERFPLHALVIRAGLPTEQQQQQQASVEMTSSGRLVPRLDLALPIERSETGRIFCTIPSVRDTRARLRPITLADCANQKINQSYPSRRLKSVSTTKSRSSSGDRLLCDSLVSFDDQNKFKSKNNNTWQNIHHPQLTGSRAANQRRLSKRSSNSIEHLCQESSSTLHEQLYARIEQLTKSYFPTVQQLRHSRPNAELINNRMHLHRVNDRNFMPNLSRTRAV